MLEPPKAGQKPTSVIAEAAAAGLASNAMSTVKLSAPTCGALDLTACVNTLTESARRVNSGDLSGAEAMLCGEAATLNPIHQWTEPSRANLTLLKDG